MQVVNKNQLTQSLNSLKLDLKLIALGKGRGGAAGHSVCGAGIKALAESEIHRSPKK